MSGSVVQGHTPGCDLICVHMSFEKGGQFRSHLFNHCLRIWNTGSQLYCVRVLKKSRKSLYTVACKRSCMYTLVALFISSAKMWHCFMNLAYFSP